jgi:hypothetical protein
MAKVIFFLACGIAFMAPFTLTTKSLPYGRVSDFREFPTEFDGRPLRDLGLSEREQGFLVDFPGQIGRFTDGNREIIIRRVTEATRKLHSASVCFEAIGYTTQPLAIKIDEARHRWSCFSAFKGGDRLKVCERIEDANGSEWTDVSSWYWSVWGLENGEWWAYTVAERTPEM